MLDTTVLTNLLPHYNNLLISYLVELATSGGKKTID